jgi:hypothetical protein
MDMTLKKLAEELKRQADELEWRLVIADDPVQVMKDAAAIQDVCAPLWGFLTGWLKRHTL